MYRLSLSNLSVQRSVKKKKNDLHSFAHTHTRTRVTFIWSIFFSLSINATCQVTFASLRSSEVTRNRKQIFVCHFDTKTIKLKQDKKREHRKTNVSFLLLVVFHVEIYAFYGYDRGEYFYWIEEKTKSKTSERWSSNWFLCRMENLFYLNNELDDHFETKKEKNVYSKTVTNLFVVCLPPNLVKLIWFDVASRWSASGN